MVYHILNGYSLAHSFPDTKIEGDIIVFREALIDGNLSGDNLNDFWQTRFEYMGFTKAEYHKNVVSEFEKLMNARNNSLSPLQTFKESAQVKMIEFLCCLALDTFPF